MVCKKIFNVKHILSRVCHPGQKPLGFGNGTRLPGQKPCPGSKTETKASLEPGQKAESVVVITNSKRRFKTNLTLKLNLQFNLRLIGYSIRSAIVKEDYSGLEHLIVSMQ